MLFIFAVDEYDDHHANTKYEDDEVDEENLGQISNNENLEKISKKK